MEGNWEFGSRVKSAVCWSLFGGVVFVIIDAPGREDFFFFRSAEMDEVTK